MRWDLVHHQGAAFPAHILRQAAVYSILTSLYSEMHLRPRDLRNDLEEAYTAAAPLVGPRDLPEGISELLAHLREHGLIVRCVYNGRGSHTRYEITRLGAGLIGALGPVTAWAMSEFDFVAAATRAKLGLPPLDGPAPDDLREKRWATGLAVGLLNGMWSNPVMVYVDSAGSDGIGPQDLEKTINADLAATTGREQVVRTLQRPVLYSVLNRLVNQGLVERDVSGPPRVRYRLSRHGSGLMAAWWQVAEDWGIDHIDDLFPIVAATSSWYVKDPSD